MGTEISDKLSAFLQWYHDLYGKEWYVANRELSGNYPVMAERQTSGSAADNAGVSHAQQELEKYRAEIENCTKCPLHKTRTKFVFGTGSATADIMFVGEAPGRDEDLQGVPFVGRAGQLLNRIFERVNLRRETVYIANILKSRPPNNRDPLPAEVAACIPYLHRQIELIRPKILVALGRVAAQNLLNNNASLGSMRGKVWEYRGIPLIVTFHPAYILRNMAMLDTAVEDLQFILAQARNQRGKE